jgi:hypothetical protein
LKNSCLSLAIYGILDELKQINKYEIVEDYKMPFFKKLTEEEKQAREQAKKDKLKQNLIEHKKVALEENIFPIMRNQKLIECIRGLDLELSTVLAHKNIESVQQDWRAIINLEHILVNDKETLLGYVGCNRKNVFGKSVRTLLVFTTVRIFFLDEHSNQINSFTYDNLMSASVETVKIIGTETMEVLKIFTNSIIYEFEHLTYPNEFADAIHRAKEDFMPNSNNVQQTESTVVICSGCNVSVKVIVGQVTQCEFCGRNISVDC